MPDHFLTERLVLRRYNPDDAALLLDISRRNNDHWQRFESGNILFGVRDMKTAIKTALLLQEEWQTQHNFFIAVFEMNSGEYAGQIYIGTQDQDMAEFEAGYVVDVDHEGKGYISEALNAVIELLFTQVATQRVTIHCSDKNPRSARVAERCGFVFTGNVQNEDGHPGISLTYSLSKKDHQEMAGHT